MAGVGRDEGGRSCGDLWPEEDVVSKVVEAPDEVGRGALGCLLIEEASPSSWKGMVLASMWNTATRILYAMARASRREPRHAWAMLKGTINHPFVGDVIDHLGIGRTTFYRYFPSDRIRELRNQA